jgi:hypothetical protein
MESITEIVEISGDYRLAMLNKICVETIRPWGFVGREMMDHSIDLSSGKIIKQTREIKCICEVDNQIKLKGSDVTGA